MSSPIAKSHKRLLDKVLIALHKKVSHSTRVNLLSDLYINILKSLNTAGNIQLLDVGCGDMSNARKMAKKNDKIQFTCIDIYPNNKNWENYYEFDGQNIPFNNKKFDIVLFSDVLHHDFHNAQILLEEAKRVSKYLIIKDHFEYGLWSRRLLQFADFIGNFGYGVSIPKQYFNKESFYKLLNDCDLNEIEQKCPIQLYEKSSVVRFIFKSKYQFISLIQ